ncbi:MAG: DUF61 family protein [Sulfolobales archaeon]|nr:DUF61 family protein [Sulfolobales archaeon]MDW8082384.1 DUF61 family protein [Sulfolobales archaeon]
MSNSDLIEILLKEELRIANKHLPRSRKTLRELLSEDYPSVLCRDGSRHFFRRSELESISRLVDRESLDNILLPIVITIVPESEGIVGIVEDRHSVELVCRALGLECEGEKIFLYRPQLYELRKNYSTIFQLALSYVVTSSSEGPDVELRT